MASGESSQNYTLFKDCLASILFSSDPPTADPEQSLDEFASYLASEAWPAIPPSLHSITYDSNLTKPIGEIDEYVSTLPLDSLSPSFTETLTSYGQVPDEEGATRLLRKVAVRYLEQATAPPPVWNSTRTKECEICEREVPLTYHHLIPRSTHAKVLKRGWHPESVINKVAWLCRPCHSVVHNVARGEELAQHYHTVDLLLEREDIQRWRKYASKQRFGVKRG
ncbi:hypothetical protein FA13DRAFT_1669312 [Coprinellus micaceus]|uniref:HNH domain-containing protein n=1 Tax=Coprinellus micaceus TaxID=71717 RepID=A0A4Y7SRT6_COPMI|nr:hypothetical protein FA13DRAFT_1669312 [Coprinellus micaceus]